MTVLTRTQHVNMSNQNESQNLTVINVRMTYKIDNVLRFRSAYVNSENALIMTGKEALSRMLLESNFEDVLKGGLREFTDRMIKKRGYRDGTEGVIYSMYQVFSRFVSYTKLWEMQNTKDVFGKINWGIVIIKLFFDVLYRCKLKLMTL